MSSIHRNPAEATPPPGADPVAERLQARFQILEAEASQAAPHPRAWSATSATGLAAPTTPSVGRQSSGEVADLNQQLEVLREQLEAAFDDVDARIAVAEQRAVAAEALAEAADTRAQIASARAGNVLYAVDDLAHELTQMAGADYPSAGRLLSAVDRLRARLSPPDVATSRPAVTPALRRADAGATQS